MCAASSLNLRPITACVSSVSLPSFPPSRAVVIVVIIVDHSYEGAAHRRRHDGVGAAHGPPDDLVELDVRRGSSLLKSNSATAGRRARRASCVLESTRAGLAV